MAFESKRIPAERLPAFMQEARERFTFALSIDSEDRADAEDDVLFAAALPRSKSGTTQWDEKTARKRIKASRPCLTENRIPTFTAQVVNDGRQSKPAIRITAMDGGTKETAEYFQSRIRQIEYDCQADVAYDTSREQQVTSGRGFLRVTWDYEPGSFRKRIRIQRIENQFSVVFGPSSEYDCSDAEYCFVINLITKEEHRRKYGSDTTAARIDFSGTENPAVGWLGTGPNGEMIQEAEYWVKEYRERTLYKLSNGKEYCEGDLPKGLEALGITIVETRKEQTPVVVQYIIDGADILGESEFIGPYIPIVPVWGRESFVQGKRRTSSLIRYAKDPQRLLNLYVSNIAEQIAQMPKSPWLVPVGGIPAGATADWEEINNDPLAYLLWKQWDEQNRPLDKPSRIVNEPPIMALVAGYNQAVDAIKAAMGIYDASLGNRSNETSGVAIDSRKRESDNANFHFHDNEARSRNHIGRILLFLIPKTDKGAAERPVRSEDGKTRMVPLGKEYKDEETGNLITHDLESGNYGVAVSTAPSYTSQRKEAVAMYGEIARADKNFMSLCGDIFFRNLDAPGADQIADRYEKALPPAMRPQKATEKPPIPPEVAQKFQMMQEAANEAIDKLTATVHQLQDEIDAERAQTESRERIVAMQEETKRTIALAQLDQKEGLALLENELATIKHRLELQQAEIDRRHAAEQAEQDRRHQAEIARQDREHQLALAAANQPPAAAPEEAAATEPPAGAQPEPPEQE